MATESPRALHAVLILAGGDGRRLGEPKAWLEWNERPLLLHVLARLAPLGAPAFVAARPGQLLPQGAYVRVDDTLTGAGPLAGLAAGLARVERDAPAARVAVCGCDYPFTDPRLYRALARRGDGSIVLPRWAGHDHPLQAVWRADLAARCAAALAAGERRVRTVVDAVDALVVDPSGISGVDPDRALLNLNDPDDWTRARSLDV